MTDLPKANSCCGCGACADACPAGCINMLPDAEGFPHPVVDREACLDCGGCSAVCPVLNAPERHEVIASYAVRNADERELMRSSSGGAFALIARETLNAGGVVCGAAFDGDLGVYHRFIESCEELPLLMGSKYAQSRTEGVCIRTREYLERGRPVLFCGTPCQTAALCSFLGGEREGLTVCDIICHGVPSPLHWRKYLEQVSKSSGRPVAANFRDKATGWRHYSVTVETENGGRISAPVGDHPHTRPFLKNVILRPSCYECAFRGTARSADITLADLWGAERILEDKDDDRGLSLVMTHTKRGEEIVSSLSGAEVRRIDTDTALTFNSPALRSPAKPACREAYMAELKDGDIIKLNKKYCADSAMVMLKKAVKRLIGR